MFPIIKEEDRILVVVPHPDDESIGCGGLLCLYSNQCEVLLVTDGGNGSLDNKIPRQQLISQRECELKNALAIAGINCFMQLNIPDGEVYLNENKFKKIDLIKYQYVFLPNKYESHKDHFSLYHILKKLKNKQKANCILIEYEVWTPLRYPVYILDISNVIEKKREMISQHCSQLRDFDYVSIADSLSSYRGKCNNLQYGEAFCPSNFDNVLRFLYHRLTYNFQKKLKSTITFFIKK